MKLNSLIVLTLLTGASVACNSRAREDEPYRSKKPAPIEELTGNCLNTWQGFERTYKKEGLLGLQKCLVFRSTDSSGNLNPANIQIDLRTAEASDAKRFANWADNNGSILRDLKGWPSAGVGEVLKLSPALDADLALAILNTYLMPTETDMRITQYPAPKVFFRYDDLIEFLEKPGSRSKVNPSDFSFDARAVALVEAYNRGFDDIHMQESLGQGCQDSCLNVTNRLKTGNFEAQLRSYEIQNEEWREEIALYDANGTVVAYASLAREKLLSVFLFERGARGELTSFTAYSPNGQQVLQKPWESTAEADLRARNSLRPASFQNGVAVCEDETSLTVLKKRGLHSSVMLGPDLQNSYYGWQSNTANVAQYWLGRTYLNNLDLPFSLETNYTDHSEAVILTLLKGGEVTDLGVVPLGADQCIRTNTWAEPLKKDGRVRVLNFSGSYFSEKEGCETMMQEHPIHDPHFLWIVAAGNQSSNRPLACPQHLTGQKNIIIVGGSENGRMHSYSNYGEDFVDIATDGYDHDRNTWGTSFAAPRVSRIAAQIFADYPSLTAEQVRLAILLGATVDNLPLRSRGELDEETARDLADLFAKGKTPEQAIKKTFWGWDVGDKLEILKQLTKETR